MTEVPDVPFGISIGPDVLIYVVCLIPILLFSIWRLGLFRKRPMPVREFELGEMRGRRGGAVNTDPLKWLNDPDNYGYKEHLGGYTEHA